MFHTFGGQSGFSIGHWFMVTISSQKSYGHEHIKLWPPEHRLPCQWTQSVFQDTTSLVIISFRIEMSSSVEDKMLIKTCLRKKIPRLHAFLMSQFGYYFSKTSNLEKTLVKQNCMFKLKRVIAQQKKI